MAHLVFYSAILMRVFHACERCKSLNRRLAVEAFDMSSDSERHASMSEALREFGRQLQYEPIQITVNSGFLLLGYHQFRAVRINRIVDKKY